MKKQIQDFSLGYYFLLPISIIATRCHYRHVVIHGRKNLPRDETFIIAPCHQNALMEPMAVLYFMHRSTVFLARADIFAKPTIRAILTFLKILPVYRIRDGKSSLSNNEQIFASAQQVLLDRVPLCLMAEGRHNDRHQLLPLVKGMFRIAGETQRAMGDKPLYIVPTGIDFDHYEEPYSNLVVHIGEPIAIQPFMEAFEHYEPVALNQMRERLTAALHQQMHHVVSKAYYDEVYALCHLLNPIWRHRKHRCNSAWNRFVTRQEIANHYNALVDDNNETMPEDIRQAREWLDLCQRHGLDLHTAAEPWHWTATLATTAAVAALIAAAIGSSTVRDILLWALFCNPIILLPTHLLAKKLIKDSQFRSSVNYGIRLVLTFLYTLVITLVALCNWGWTWGALALATALVVARLNALLHPLLRNWLRNLRHSWLYITHSSDLRRMKEIQRNLTK